MTTKQYVLDKLRVKFSVDILKEDFELSFFSHKVGLTARNMLDLLYDIENELKIEFDKKILMDENLCTLKGIVEAIDSIGGLN